MRLLRKIIGTLVVLICLSMATMLLLMWPERAKVEEGATLVKAIEGRLTQATSQADVRNWLSEPGFESLKMTPGETQVLVSSPPAGNAENWILVLTFEAGRLRASRVGTMDSLNRPPHAAPSPRRYAN